MSSGGSREGGGGDGGGGSKQQHRDDDIKLISTGVSSTSTSSTLSSRPKPISNVALSTLKLAQLKNHPQYCTPKFLAKDQIIYPEGKEYAVACIISHGRKTPAKQSTSTTSTSTSTSALVDESSNTDSSSSSSSSSSTREEHLVYPIAHLRQIRSRDKWLRVGRIVRDGERPVRTDRVAMQARRGRGGGRGGGGSRGGGGGGGRGRGRGGDGVIVFEDDMDDGRSKLGDNDDDDDDGDNDGETVRYREIELFGDWQTMQQTSETTRVLGIPTNQFGNVEVLSEASVPPGCVHIPQQEAIEVANRLNIPYAHAVVAFAWASSGATPVRQGIVIRLEDKEIIRAGVQELVKRRADEAAARRRRRLINIWERLVRKLAIHTQIDEDTKGRLAMEELKSHTTSFMLRTGGSGSSSSGGGGGDNDDDDDDQEAEEDEDGGGGFSARDALDDQ